MSDIASLCRTVGELRDTTFVIPDYQRGYRWTEQEVRDLLNDLSNFDTGSKSNQLFYYLQPLVVKRLGENEYEVVDGQQRLTTIFIIIKFAEDEMKSAKCPYILEYKTRKGSKSYLECLTISSVIDKQNIDYFHITTARKTIWDWLDFQPDKAVAVTDIYTRLISYTRFIWYEISDTVDPKVEFRKLNIGRIRLTNAELIKALLLSKDNFKNEKHEKLISKRQDEISIAWDNIEQHLQQPDFWSFLRKENKNASRIDLIFELIAGKHVATLKQPPKPSDEYYSFLVIYQCMILSDAPDKFVEKIWREVEAIYDRFCDWYSDLEKYHLIGYLTHTGASIENVLKLCEQVPSGEAVSKLKPLANDMKKYSTITALSDIDYKNQKKEHLRNLLLLFNIATLICKSEKQDRFPFDIYLKNEWDIEHIHAIRDKLPGKLSDALVYLQSLKEEFARQASVLNASDDRKAFYSNALKEIEQFLLFKNAKQKDAEDFYSDLCSKYPSILQADNGIGNLALLDRKTNRSYKNVSYGQKRREIIKLDSAGRFIPLCTRNVFLKYYSPKATRLTRWEDDEREDYKAQISNTLSEFFEGV